MRSKEFLVIVILIVSVIIFIKISRGDVVYILSDIDQEYYLVRDVPDKQEAANLLARIRQNINSLVIHLNNNIKKYPDNIRYISQLTSKISGSVINESSADSEYTSYSVNKGEQIVFCIRSKRGTNLMHSLNLMMYVTLHELAHVACPEYGHTPLFKEIFSFLTQVAVDLEMYKKINFNENPTEYCGLTIRDSII